MCLLGATATLLYCSICSVRLGLIDGFVQTSGNGIPFHGKTLFKIIGIGFGGFTSNFLDKLKLHNTVFVGHNHYI